MKIVLLLSGGMDSAALYAHACGTNREVVPVFIDYGQPSLLEEEESARHIAEHFGAELVVRGLDLSLHDMGAQEGVSGPRVVPARNLVFLSLGVHQALIENADQVWLGASLDDFSDYADCRDHFVEAVNIASVLLGVRVRYPFCALTKSQILEEAKQHDFDVSNTWSCYTPSNGSACGTCNSCKQRNEVLS